MASSLHPVFLRPTNLPGPASLQRVLGAARASRAMIRAESTSAASVQAEQATLAASRPYRITLTRSKGLPIYLLAKRGGNKKLTRIRRIEGDVKELKKDLQEALGMDGKDVTINQLTKQIIVKGHMKPQIQQFFTDRPSTVL
ncbi:unnamed protein product [Diplocarpon coronariae]|uniref:Large ribosomal subunit protein mL49 n=1 Tax=Diplocarpon coronariae TaxID=2795749 RepID=A0A218ZAF6_9HELO|nr:hypothetical protein B2J93_1429 [Marssonina coronariae]